MNKNIFTDSDAIDALLLQRRSERGLGKLIEVTPKIIEIIRANPNKILGKRDAIKDKFINELPAVAIDIVKQYDNLVIAGSAVTAAVCGCSKVPNDIDIFIVDPVEYDHAKSKTIKSAKLSKQIKEITAGLKDINHTDRSVTFRKNYKNIQIVKHIYRSSLDLLNDFDLCASKFLFDGTKFWTTEFGEVFWKTGISVVDDANIHKKMKMRINKYLNKGYAFYFPFAKNIHRSYFVREMNIRINDKEIPTHDADYSYYISDDFSQLVEKLLEIPNQQVIKGMLKQYKNNVWGGNFSYKLMSCVKKIPKKSFLKMYKHRHYRLIIDIDWDLYEKYCNMINHL
jgi:hypothetical protein